MCWTPLWRKQTQITLIKHKPSYKQLEVKTNRTSFLCGNRNGQHNTELRTQRHAIGQHTKKERWATRIPQKKPTGDGLRWWRIVSSSCFL
jgi:hypothetical protein